MTSFDTLLPSDAVVIEADSEWFWQTGLLPAERRYVAAAVEKRRREFTAGRNCARLALEALGIQVVPIGVGTHREPIFPTGITGSITHTGSYCAAAVMRRGNALSIGIDAELAQPLDEELKSLVLVPQERSMIEALGTPDSCVDTLVFSIKEAFYKAYFQVEPEYLDFLDACVRIFPSKHCFHVRVLSNGVGTYFRSRIFEGRYRFDGRHVYAAVALPAA